MIIRSFCVVLVTCLQSGVVQSVRINTVGDEVLPPTVFVNCFVQHYELTHSSFTIIISLFIITDMNKLYNVYKFISSF